tara:strand:+ start:1742 stop:1963 length:222 start_codon:yes stop_codon:yes gene_type:complete
VRGPSFAASIAQFNLPVQFNQFLQGLLSHGVFEISQDEKHVLCLSQLILSPRKIIYILYNNSNIFLKKRMTNV